MTNIIENKDWSYTLYRNEDNYTLSVPLAEPAPGFDVIHELNKDEVKDYKEKGMESLLDRVKDMNIHFRNYKLVSWR